MGRSEVMAAFAEAVERYERSNGLLPGIARPEYRAAFLEQLAASARTTLLFERMLASPGGPAEADPKDEDFDPLRAAILAERSGSYDDACWLVFLSIHFGKHRRSGWHYVADIYGRLGDPRMWSWSAVSTGVPAFRDWLAENEEVIKQLDPRRGFGNHRKYESLDAWSAGGTGAVIASYVDWVGPAGHHATFAAATSGAMTRTERFDALYKAVQTSVHRFGRTAAFDYCSTLGKLKFVDVEPSAACLTGATGPLKGAKLLLTEPGRPLSPRELERHLAPLRTELDVGFDVLEDALCNWQKSPAEFRPFRG